MPTQKEISLGQIEYDAVASTVQHNLKKQKLKELTRNNISLENELRFTDQPLP